MLTIVVIVTTDTTSILMMVKEGRLLFKLEQFVATVYTVYVQTDEEKDNDEVGDTEGKEVLATEVVIYKVTAARVTGTTFKTFSHAIS